MPDTDPAIAIGILQAAIIAIPFWLTSTQYLIHQQYADGDTQYRIPTAIMGSIAVLGFLSLLLAAQFSAFAMLSDAGKTVSAAIRLIMLFTAVSFAMLIWPMTLQMTADRHPYVAFKYGLTFAVFPSAIAVIYVIEPTGVLPALLLLAFLVLAFIVTSVYAFRILPWLNVHSHPETDATYPELVTAVVSTVYRRFSGTSGAVSSKEAERYRKVLERLGYSDAAVDAAIAYVRERYAKEDETEEPE